MSPHLPVNPDGMPEPRGFAHGVLAESGRVLYIAGETGHHEDLSLDDDFVAQFGQAVRNVARVVTEAGGKMTDVVSLTIYVTSVDDYRSRLGEIGVEYQAAFGKHFPAMALLGVSELVDSRAMVEILGVAVIPD